MASTPAAGEPHSSRYPWPQVTVLVVGAAYFLVGLVGFTVTGFDDFFPHNLVHLVFGLFAASVRAGPTCPAPAPTSAGWW